MGEKFKNFREDLNNETRWLVWQLRATFWMESAFPSSGEHVDPKFMLWSMLGESLPYLYAGMHLLGFFFHQPELAINTGYVLVFGTKLAVENLIERKRVGY